MQQEVQKDPKLIKAWVKALRSGRYEQTKHTLAIGSRKGGYSYCCLGVLCRVAKAKFLPDEQTFLIEGEFRDSTLNPDSRLAKRAGLTLETHGELMQMNDTEGKDFKQIAKHIEQTLLPKKPKAKKKVGKKAVKKVVKKVAPAKKKKAAPKAKKGKR